MSLVGQLLENVLRSTESAVKYAINSSWKNADRGYPFDSI